MRQIALVLVLLILGTSPLLAAPTTAEYLSWLGIRRQLWVSEMKRLETHEHGQYREEYHRLSQRINEVRQQAEDLRRAGDDEKTELQRQLMEKVSLVEQSLEFLLSEAPELAEKDR